MSVKYIYEIVVARSLDSIGTTKQSGGGVTPPPDCHAPIASGLAMTATYAMNFGDTTLVTGDRELSLLFRAANHLHINFYENWLPPESVEQASAEVKRLLAKLEALIRQAQK